MFHRVFTPPCVRSTVSSLHHGYVLPCLYSAMSMIYHVFTPSCLCSTTDRRVLYSIVSLLRRGYVPPLTGGFNVPSCLYSTMSLFHH